MELIKDIATNTALVIAITGAVAVVGKQWIDFLLALEAYKKNHKKTKNVFRLRKWAEFYKRVFDKCVAYIKKTLFLAKEPRLLGPTSPDKKNIPQASFLNFFIGNQQLV